MRIAYTIYIHMCAPPRGLRYVLCAKRGEPKSVGELASAHPSAQRRPSSSKLRSGRSGPTAHQTARRPQPLTQ